MKFHRYFPLGKAYGEAFCNRFDETKKLVANIQRGVHTFLLAPRRYGKSSLCEKAFEQIAYPWSKVDFHLAVTEKDAERFIIKGVEELIGKSIGQVDKFTTVIVNTLKHLKPKFSLTKGPFSLELEISGKSTPAENVADALLLLEILLRGHNNQAVLLFDEFQEVGNVSKGKGIEGAIRHAAQETTHLSIIFSGSNPHMIQTMFENERRPLYKLCKKISLPRISQQHYENHLNKAAQHAWKHNLNKESFEYIMHVTERHPYYVNALCDEIWAECDTSPTLTDIHQCWEQIVEGERSDLIKEFLRLSPNQRKVLIYLANFSSTELFSSDAAQHMQMATGSLSTAVAALIERDYIEKINNHYKIIVPAYRFLLSEM